MALSLICFSPFVVSIPKVVNFFYVLSIHVASHQLRFRYARRARFVVITVLTVVATTAVDDPPVLRLLIGSPSLARARNARLYADSGT